MLNLISDDGSVLMVDADPVNLRVAEGTGPGNEGKAMLTYTLNSPPPGANLELVVSRGSGTSLAIHDSTTILENTNLGQKDIDYSLSTSRLALNAGNNYTGTITMTTVADANQESLTEILSLAYELNDIATNMPVANAVFPGSTLLRIIDDDQPRASITSATDTISERAANNPDCGVGTLCRIYQVRMDRPYINNTASVMVAFTSSDPTGATVLGTDYTITPVNADGTMGEAVTSSSSTFTLMFPNNAADTVAFFTVTVRPDSDTEGAGTISFSLPASERPSIYTVADNPGTVAVTIVDGPGITADIEANVATISENGTASADNACTDSPSSCSVVTVRLNQHAPAGGVPVVMTLTTGGAANATDRGTGADYTVSEGVTIDDTGGTTTFTVEVPEDMNAASFTITAEDDSDYEEDGTLALALRAGLLYKLTDTASRARTVITIESEDAVASISVSGGSSPRETSISEEVGEGRIVTGGITTVTVSFNPPLSAATGLVIWFTPMGGAYHDLETNLRDIVVSGAADTLPRNITENDVIPGSTITYSGTARAILTIPDTAVSAGTATFSFVVAARTDTRDSEVGEHYILTLQDVAGYNVAAPSNSATIHILDDETTATPEVSISSSSGNITEGTARNCAAAFDPAAPSECTTITVTLNTPGRSAVNVTVARAYAGIGVPGAVEAADYTLRYGNTPIIVSGNMFTVTVPAGRTTASFIMTAVDDGLIEADGFLSFTVQPDIPENTDMPDKVDYTVAASPNNTTNIGITNDPMERARASISIVGSTNGVTTITEAEGASNSATIMVSFDRAPTTAVNLFLGVATIGTATFDANGFSDVAATNLGAATSDVLFGTVFRILNVPANSSSFSFDIAANSDDGDDNSEGYELILSFSSAFTVAEVPDGADCVDNPNCVTVFIEDEDATTTPSTPVADIAISTTTIIEGAPERCTTAFERFMSSSTATNCATVTVSLEDATGTDVLARTDITVIVGIAYSGAADATTISVPANNRIDDYIYGEGVTVAVSRTTLNVTVPAGQSTASFTITARDDVDIEANGIVTYTLNPGDGYTVTDTAADYSTSMKALAAANATRFTIESDEALLLASIETNVATITENNTAGFDECGDNPPTNCAMLSVLIDGIVRTDGLAGAPPGGFPVMISITAEGGDEATQAADYTVVDENNMPIAVTGNTFQFTIEEDFGVSSFHVKIEQDAEVERDGILTFTIVPSPINNYIVTRTEYNAATPLAAASSTRVTLESEELPVANIRVSTGAGGPAAEAAISEAAGSSNSATITVTFTPFLVVDSTNLRLRVASINSANTRFKATDVNDRSDVTLDFGEDEFFVENDGPDTSTSARFIVIPGAVQTGESTYTFTVTGRGDSATDPDERYTFALQAVAANTYTVGVVQNTVTVRVQEGTPSGALEASITTSTTNILEDSTDSSCTGFATSNCAIVTVSLNGVVNRDTRTMNRGSPVFAHITPTIFGTAGAIEANMDYTLSGLSPRTSIPPPPGSFTISIPVGYSAASFTITAVADELVEANGGFTFTLTPVPTENVAGGGYSVAASPANAASVTITNSSDANNKTSATVQVAGTSDAPSAAARSATVTEGETENNPRVTVTFAEPHPASPINLLFSVKPTPMGNTNVTFADGAFSDIEVGGFMPAGIAAVSTNPGLFIINNIPAGGEFSFTITAPDDAADAGEGYELTLISSSAYSVAEVPEDATTCADNPNCISIHIEDGSTVPPVASIAASNTTVDESVPVSDDRSCTANSNCSTVTVSLSRAVGHDVWVIVSFTATGDAIVAGTDYMIEGLSEALFQFEEFGIVVPALQTSVSFTIIAVDDDVIEEAGVLAFTVRANPAFDPARYTVAASPGNAATVTIASDDLPVARISSSATSIVNSPLTVDEGGSVTIAVHFSQALALADNAFTFVQFSVTRVGTVTHGLDSSVSARDATVMVEDPVTFTYISGSSALTFQNVKPVAADATSPVIYSFTLDIVEDDGDDDGEGFILRLTPPVNDIYTIDAALAELAIYINDTEEGGAAPVPVARQISVPVFDSTITEGQDANCSVTINTSCAMVSVLLDTLAPAGGLPVRIGISETASASSIPQPSDYMVTGGVDLSSSPFTVTVPAGADRVSFTITANDDDIIEAAEGWAFTLMADDAATARYTITSPPATARLVIASDEPLLVASISANTTAISEGGVNNCTVSSGANCAIYTVTLDRAVPLTNDGVVLKMSGLRILAADRAYYLDDFTVSGPTASVAGAGISTNLLVVIQPGQAMTSFTVTAVNDNVYEADEIISLSLFTEGGELYTINQSAFNTQVTIRSDDAPMISINVAHSSGEISIEEGSADTFEIIVAPALPAGAALHGLRLRFEAFGGAARFLDTTPGARSDITVPDNTFSSPTADGLTTTIVSQTLDNTSSSALQAVFSVVVTAQDDTVNNYGDRGYRISIEDAPPGYFIDTSADSVTINIVDNEVPTITMFSNVTLIRENGTDTAGCDDLSGGMFNCATVWIRLDVPARNDLELPVVVTERGADDANDLGDDYTVTIGDTPVTQLPFTVPVPAGQTLTSFIVTAVDDRDVEPNNGVVRFTLPAETVTHPDYFVAQQNTTNIVILSEDVGEASITVTAPGGSAGAVAAIPEAGATLEARRATLTITLDPPLTATVSASIMFSAIGGAGMPGTADSMFVGNPGITGDTVQGELEFSNGIATIGLNILDDTAYDPGEGYTFTLLPVASAYTVADAPDNSVTVNIIDDDTHVANIYIGTINNPAITTVEKVILPVFVALNGPAPSPAGLTVNILADHTTHAQPTAAEDYALTDNTGTLTGDDPNYMFNIPAGMTVASFIMTIADEVVEGDAIKTAQIRLQDGTGYNVGSSAVASATIRNRTNMTAPDPVTALGARPGDGEVTLSWTTLLGNIIVTRITTTAGETSVSTLVVATGGNAMYTQAITGLSNGTEYTFSLVTVNGSGNESTAVETMATPGVPVASITVTAPGETEPETTGTVTVPESGDDDARTATITATFDPALKQEADLELRYDGIGTADIGLNLTPVGMQDATVANASLGSLSIPDGAVGTSRLHITRIPAETTTVTFDLVATSDTVDDEGEGYTFILQDGADSSYTAHPTNNTITINIEDDDNAVSIYAMATDGSRTTTPSVVEGNSLDITVESTIPAPAGGIETTIVYASGASIMDGDVTLSSNTGTIDASNAPNYTFTIPVGETSATFTVSTGADIIDGTVQVAGQVSFTLMLSGDYSTGTMNAVTLTISEKYPFMAIYESIASNGSYDTEVNVIEGTVAAITVAPTESSGGVTSDTIVGIMVTYGTAMAEDFSLIAGSGLLTIGTPPNPGDPPIHMLTIAEGRDSATFNVRASASVVDTGEEPKSATITLVAGDGYNQTIVDSVTVNIINRVDTVTEFTAVPGNGRALLSWTNPADPRSGVTVTEVIVSVFAPGGVPVDLNGDTAGYDLLLPATAGAMVSHSVEGLENGTEYTFSIVMVDSSGNKSLAETEFGIIPGTVEAVTAPAAAPGSGLVVLSWTNPDSIDLSSVTVSATVGGTPFDLNGDAEGNSLTVPAMPGTAGSQVILGLTNDTEYSFTIVAVDSGGNVSDASDPVTATPVQSTATLTTDATSLNDDGDLDEGEAASFTVTLSHAPPAGAPPTNVLVTAAPPRDGSASDADIGPPGGANYEETVTIGATTYHVIRIAATNSTGTFTIQAAADNTYEKGAPTDEAFVVTIVTPPGDPDAMDYNRYAPSSTATEVSDTITIIDGDTIPVISAAPDTYYESVTTRNSVMLLLSPKNEYDATTMVTVTTAGSGDNPATLQDDFTEPEPPPSHTVTVPADTDSFEAYGLIVTDDAVYDGAGNEQFTITVQDDPADPDTYTAGAPTIFNIVDNETKSVASVAILDNTGNPIVFSGDQELVVPYDSNPHSMDKNGFFIVPIFQPSITRVSLQPPLEVEVIVEFSPMGTISYRTSHERHHPMLRPSAPRGLRVPVPPVTGISIVKMAGIIVNQSADFTIDTPADDTLYTVAPAPMNAFTLKIVDRTNITLAVNSQTINEAGETTTTITVTRTRTQGYDVYPTPVVLELTTVAPPVTPPAQPIAVAELNTDFRVDGLIPRPPRTGLLGEVQYPNQYFVNDPVGIPAGEENTSITFTVTAIDDGDDDDNEKIIYTLVDIPDYEVPGTAPSVTITITDND